MAHSIRISDDLYAQAQYASQALKRPLAQQMEYWARLGLALDAAGISTTMAMRLLDSGASADAFVAEVLSKRTASDGGLLMLKEIQRKDSEDVAAGRRSARSLMAFQKGDLVGYTLAPNKNSEFDHAGSGW